MHLGCLEPWTWLLQVDAAAGIQFVGWRLAHRAGTGGHPLCFPMSHHQAHVQWPMAPFPSVKRQTLAHCAGGWPHRHAWRRSARHPALQRPQQAVGAKSAAVRGPIASVRARGLQGCLHSVTAGWETVRLGLAAGHPWGPTAMSAETDSVGSSAKSVLEAGNCPWKPAVWQAVGPRVPALAAWAVHARGNVLSGSLHLDLCCGTLKQSVAHPFELNFSLLWRLHNLPVATWQRRVWGVNKRVLMNLRGGETEVCRSQILPLPMCGRESCGRRHIVVASHQVMPEPTADNHTNRLVQNPTRLGDLSFVQKAAI